MKERHGAAGYVPPNEAEALDALTDLTRIVTAFRSTEEGPIGDCEYCGRRTFLTGPDANSCVDCYADAIHWSEFDLKGDEADD